MSILSLIDFKPEISKQIIKSINPKIVDTLIPSTRPEAPPTSDKNVSQALNINYFTRVKFKGLVIFKSGIRIFALYETCYVIMIEWEDHCIWKK